IELRRSGRMTKRQWLSLVVSLSNHEPFNARPSTGSGRAGGCMRAYGVGVFLLVSVPCPSAPPAAAPAPAPKAVDPRSYEQKVAAMLRLEDQRILRDPAPPPPPPARSH